MEPLEAIYFSEMQEADFLLRMSLLFLLLSRRLFFFFSHFGAGMPLPKTDCFKLSDMGTPARE